MGRRRQFWIGSDRIERKHYGAWAEEERWTSSPASYSLMEAGALLRVKIDRRVFSRDDVTKCANYIGTRNGPHCA